MPTAYDISYKAGVIFCPQINFKTWFSFMFSSRFGDAKCLFGVGDVGELLLPAGAHPCLMTTTMYPIDSETIFFLVFQGILLIYLNFDLKIKKMSDQHRGR